MPVAVPKSRTMGGPASRRRTTKRARRLPLAGLFPRSVMHFPLLQEVHPLPPYFRAHEGKPGHATARSKGSGLRVDARWLPPTTQLLLPLSTMRSNAACLIVVGLVGLANIGCTILVSNATSGLTDDVSTALVDQSDPILVRDGAPAYLILIEGLIAGSPENQDLLLAAARLYSSYASAFVDDRARSSALNAKARDYGERVLCLNARVLCEAIVGPFDVFEAQLQRTDKSDLPALYGFGSAWAGYIQANAADWNAVAELPKVQALMERVIALDSSYADGGAQLYLGVLYTLRPAHLGGLPEIGKAHFERAIAISNHRNLMAKVFFARNYARLVFDRDLHDRLLMEVVEADPVAPGFTLSNTLAQDMAQELLTDADDYF